MPHRRWRATFGCQIVCFEYSRLWWFGHSRGRASSDQLHCRLAPFLSSTNGWNKSASTKTFHFLFSEVKNGTRNILQNCIGYFSVEKLKRRHFFFFNLFQRTIKSFGPFHSSTKAQLSSWARLGPFLDRDNLHLPRRFSPSTVRARSEFINGGRERTQNRSSSMP